MTSEGQALGSPDYIAPEQIVDAQSADIRADIYSLGSTLYYLLTGRPPFQANSLYDVYQAHISRDAERLNLVRPEVPSELAALVAKMMAKEPTRRFQRPAEVAHALTPFFQKANAAFRVPRTDMSRAVATDAGRPRSGAVSTPIQPATDGVGAPKESTKGTASESRWASMSGFTKPGPTAEPEPKTVAERRGLWAGPIAIAASLCGAVAPSLIIITINSKSGETKITVDNRPKVESASAKSQSGPVAANRIPPAGPARRALSVKGALWSVEGDELVKEGLGRGTVTFGDVDWSDYDLTFEARKSAGPDGLGVAFRSSDGRLYSLVLGSLNASHLLGIWSRAPTKRNPWLRSTPGTIRPLEWYKVKISLRGQFIRVQLDEHLLFACKDDFCQKGNLFLCCYDSAGRFRNIKVTAADGSVLWEGVPDLPETGKDAEPVVVKQAAQDEPRPAADAPAPMPPIPAAAELVKNKIGMELKLISAGEFDMGSPNKDVLAQEDESPQHEVRISRPFYLGATEVTVGQFRQFVKEAHYQTEAEKNGAGGGGWNQAKAAYEKDPAYTWLNPGFAQADDDPVVLVSWNDAIAFCNGLSSAEGLNPYYHFAKRQGGDGYRLPTEAEWEYACRAGTITRYQSGDDPESLAKVANVADRTAAARYPGLGKFAIAARDGFVHTAPVGQLRANKFGLFDMHGNVAEWCWDAYGQGFYARSPFADPAGNEQPIQNGQPTPRVVRGGNWLGRPTQKCPLCCSRQSAAGRAPCRPRLSRGPRSDAVIAMTKNLEQGLDLKWRRKSPSVQRIIG